MMNFMKLLITHFFILVLMVSCESNPYPDGDKYTEKKAPIRLPVKPALSADIPQKLEFYEGRVRSYKVRYLAPDNEKVKIRIENLPRGAIYKEDEESIYWKPSFSDANDPKNPIVTSMLYPVEVYIYLEKDPKKSLSEKMLFVVHDTPQSFEISSAKSTSVDEGSKLEFVIKVESEDFPNGPFKMISDGLPAGANIKNGDSNNEFILTYQPDFYRVKTSGSSSCGSRVCLKDAIKLKVVNPRNQVAEQDFALTINDSRQKGIVANPKNLTQGLDFNFQVQASDLNGEIPPRFTFSKYPNFGEFSWQVVETKENFSSNLIVRWVDIPIEYVNTSHEVRFEVCVNSRFGTANNCESQSLTLNIQSKEHLPPIMKRMDWPSHEIKYFVEGELARFNMTIEDAERSTNQIKVEILPKEIQNQVKFVNGQLQVNFQKNGIYQFTVVASSPYKMQSSENFMVEVFSKERSKAIYLTDAARTNEVKFYREIFPNIDIYNPLLQKLTNRELAKRDTLILGTSLLVDKEASSVIMTLVKNAKTVVVSTPLLINLPAELVKIFTVDYGINIAGRLQEIPLSPPLGKLYMEYPETIGLKNPENFPNDLVALKGTTSSESISPLIFSVGLSSSECKRLFELREQVVLNRYNVGAVCRKENGGKYLLIGFEWADLKVGLLAHDQDIPKQWLTHLMNYPIEDLMRDLK